MNSMNSKMLNGIYEKYSRSFYRFFDNGINLAYWSFKVAWYFIPVMIGFILLSIAIFTLTWIFYLIFYWFFIPIKAVTFSLNFDFKNKYLSQFYIDNYHINDIYYNKTILGEFQEKSLGDRIYNNIINSNDLTRQLLYEQSEATALVNFNNITWRVKSSDNEKTENKSGNKTNTQINYDNVSVYEKDKDLNFSYLTYLISLKSICSRKLYNLITFNWFKRKYYKDIDEGLSKDINGRFENKVNTEILGNEIDIIVELYYYPSQYNINISPFQLSLDLIQCIESNPELRSKDQIQDNILAKFKKTTAVEYLPDVLIRFREYISVIPSLLGLKINSLGLGLENKLDVKVAENFPLLRKHPFDINSINKSIKLCGAKVKMRPALHITQSKLIFQTKLPFWKEIIRGHPILMGNVISILSTFTFMTLTLLIALISGIYLLWSKYSISNYNDFYISNSHLPTGTVTYTNYTPNSPFQIDSNNLTNHLNNRDYDSSVNKCLSPKYDQLLINYSQNNSSIDVNGLLPLETKQITHPKNHYVTQSPPANDCPVNEIIKKERSEDSNEEIVHPKLSVSSSESPNI